MASPWLRAQRADQGGTFVRIGYSTPRVAAQVVLEAHERAAYCTHAALDGASCHEWQTPDQRDTPGHDCHRRNKIKRHGCRLR